MILGQVEKCMMAYKQMERHLTQSYSCNHYWRFLCILIRVWKTDTNLGFSQVSGRNAEQYSHFVKTAQKKVLFLKIKTSMYLPHNQDALIPLLDLTRKMKTCLHKDWHIDVYNSIIHNQQSWKQPKCLSNKLNKCINKLWYITQQ